MPSSSSAELIRYPELRPPYLSLPSLHEAGPPFDDNKNNNIPPKDMVQTLSARKTTQGNPPNNFSRPYMRVRCHPLLNPSGD